MFTSLKKTIVACLMIYPAQLKSLKSKISCYFLRNVVTVKLRKECLNKVTCSTSVLLRIKNWTAWYRTLFYVNICGTYKHSKQSGFLAHPVYISMTQC